MEPKFILDRYMMLHEHGSKEYEIYLIQLVECGVSYVMTRNAPVDRQGRAQMFERYGVGPGLKFARTKIDGILSAKRERGYELEDQAIDRHLYSEDELPNHGVHPAHIVKIRKALVDLGAEQQIQTATDEEIDRLFGGKVEKLKKIIKLEDGWGEFS